MNEKTLAEEAAWIRRKLGLPEDCPFLGGPPSVAGAMHVVCSNAHGYTTYIEAFRCDDKQGEIARLAVARDKLIDVLRMIASKDCGCSPVCQCDTESSLRTFKQVAQDAAFQVLSEVVLSELVQRTGQEETSGLRIDPIEALSTADPLVVRDLERSVQS